MEFTDDIELIRSVLLNPSNEIFDDYSDGIEYNAPENGFHLVSEDKKCVVLLLGTGSPLIIEMHSGILPEARGNCKQYFNFIVEWLLKNTHYQSVTTYSPVNNPSAVYGARKAGFTEVGTVRNYTLFHGKPIDAILFQYVLKEYESCQQP